MSSRKKIMITLIIILLLLTAGVYGYGVYYFTEHFLPGSMVNGFNCSYMTVSQSEELLTQKVGAYVLTIDTRNNGQESITAKQAGLSYDSDGSVDKLIRNQRSLYMVFLLLISTGIMRCPPPLNMMGRRQRLPFPN